MGTRIFLLQFHSNLCLDVFAFGMTVPVILNGASRLLLSSDSVAFQSLMVPFSDSANAGSVYCCDFHVSGQHVACGGNDK